VEAMTTIMPGPDQPMFDDLAPTTTGPVSSPTSPTRDRGPARDHDRTRGRSGRSGRRGRRGRASDADTGTRPVRGGRGRARGASHHPGQCQADGTRLPLRTVTSPVPLTRENVAHRVDVDPTIALTEDMRVLWDQAADESRRAARLYDTLAPYWGDRENEFSDPDDGQLADMTIAAARRCSINQAHRLIRRAHRSVDLLPAVHERLADGELPATWHEQILARTSDFTDREMDLVDEAISTWELTLAPEQFLLELRRLVVMILDLRETPPYLDPAARRRVDLMPPKDDGTGTLQVTGPIPETLAYVRRLDQAARAIQAAQRHALDARADAAMRGEQADVVIPMDVDEFVSATGRPLTLAQIRHQLVLTAEFDTDGVHVPAPAFRINLTIPALTLLGDDNEPGVLDGTIPVPADMARALAANDPVWYRVLTDPCTGQFLPLPADRYQATASMREHLRLRGPVCSVPGCGRPTGDWIEFDHIQEYDRTGNGNGGPTAVENLHPLCPIHHGLKTRQRIDPVRQTPEQSPTRTHGTRWTLAERVDMFIADTSDLTIDETVTAYQNAWQDHQTRVAQHQRLHEQQHPPRGDHPLENTSPNPDPSTDPDPGPGSSPPRDSLPPPPF
jgi:hypothetical protein